VIETPGHSQGHVAYFDEANGLLFSGDTAYRGPMYACFKGGDPAAFQFSAQRLAALANQVQTIFPGHNELLSGGEFLTDLAAASNKALSGEAPAKPPDEFIGGREVSFGSFAIWLPKED
jgi:glyoxylase-like metal-dependent hydrolase (beta-lactamase superfamily II)